MYSWKESLHRKFLAFTSEGGAGFTEDCVPEMMEVV
jgi:hypothetical protein